MAVTPVLELSHAAVAARSSVSHPTKWQIAVAPHFHRFRFAICLNDFFTHMFEAAPLRDASDLHK